MIAPRIHLGGTSAEELLSTFEEAGRRLHEALTALGATCPNGRDYYPLGDGALRMALTEHDSRIAALRKVLAEITEIHENLVEQEDARQAAKRRKP